MPLTKENITLGGDGKMWATWSNCEEVIDYAKEQTIFNAPSNAKSAVIRFVTQLAHNNMLPQPLML